MEKITREYLKLENKRDTTHDHIKSNNTIEQKSARYSADGNDWKWQHIEINHDWDYLLLCGLDFKEIKFYIAPRKTIELLIKNKIIEGQGKKKDGVGQPQQGYWFSRSDFRKKNKLFINYFTEIKNENELNKFLNTS